MSIDTPFTKENLDTYLKELGKEFRKLNGKKISAEYLIAMKLMSGRQYKNDLSDIAGILWEHQKNGNPISRDAIDKAITVLYGDIAELPPISKRTIDDAFSEGDYERAYREIRESEKQAKDILLDFDTTYPGELKGENIDAILTRAKAKRQKSGGL